MFFPPQKNIKTKCQTKKYKCTKFFKQKKKLCYSKSLTVYVNYWANIGEFFYSTLTQEAVVVRIRVCKVEQIVKYGLGKCLNKIDRLLCTDSQILVSSLPRSEETLMRFTGICADTLYKTVCWNKNCCCCHS